MIKKKTHRYTDESWKEKGILSVCSQVLVSILFLTNTPFLLFGAHCRQNVAAPWIWTSMLPLQQG